jgi:exosortase/archaeosortase family protein
MKPSHHSARRKAGPPGKTSNHGKQRTALLFVLTFIALMGFFYFLYSHPLVERALFIPLANMYAWISGKFLSVAGYANIVVGDMISSIDSFSVGVKKGCDAAEPMAIFIAGIVAFKAGIRQKLAGLTAGLAILFVLNIVRIISLYIAGIHYPELFETLHLGVWQVVFIMVAIILWYIWLQRIAIKPIPKW